MNLVESLKLKWDLSLFSLIVTNLIVIVLAVLQHWDFPTLIYIYIQQTKIIGIFFFLRIVFKKKVNFEGIKVNNQPIFPNVANKFFFAFVFGIIFFVILRFYNILFFHLKPTINIFIYLSISLFFINHLISFLTNFKSDQEKEESLKHMLATPFFRIIPMHLILFIGNIFNTQIIAFLILKTIADIYMHNYIHGNIIKPSSPASKIKDNNVNVPVVIKNNLTNQTTLTNISLDKNISLLLSKWMAIMFCIIFGGMILLSLIFGLTTSALGSPFGSEVSILPILVPLIFIAFFILMWIKYKNDPNNPGRNNKGIAIVSHTKEDGMTLIDIKNIKGIDIGIKGIGFSFLLLLISAVVFCISWIISFMLMSVIIVISSISIAAASTSETILLNAPINNSWFFASVLIIPIITTMLVNFFIIRNKLKKGELSKIVFFIYLGTIMAILLNIIFSVFN